MFLIANYSIAIFFCVVTMLCWGSWANTQKLASKGWHPQLFYWDYVLGILFIALVFAFTLGSTGEQGRSFLADLAQADAANLRSALVGGAVFNLANILLVAAITIAGMSVAFPVGIGIALILGVVVNYLGRPEGTVGLLFGGVALVAVAILLNASAYRRLSEGQGAVVDGHSGVSTKDASTRGLLLSVVAGVLMGFFYKYVADSMATNFATPEVGKLTPYTALVLFAMGIFFSNFIFNTALMYRPFSGEPTSYAAYFQGSGRDHAMGLLGGIVWMVGMSFSILASGEAGPAISYGLGQGATVVAAVWGIFIWKEFRHAPKGTATLLNLMLACYVVGLGLIIWAR